MGHGRRNTSTSSTPPARAYRSATDWQCPTCRAGPAEPCQQVTLSAEGSIKLGRTLTTMHAKRRQVSQRPAATSTPPPQRPRRLKRGSLEWERARDAAINISDPAARVAALQALGAMPKRR